MFTTRSLNRDGTKRIGAGQLLRRPRLSDEIELRLPKKSDYDRVFEFKDALAREGLTFFGSRMKFQAERWIDWAIEASANGNAAISVAFAADKVAGISEVSGNYHREGTLVISVADWARRAGVGDALMKDVLLKSKDLFSMVVLYVNYSNAAAQGLYRKHGFSRCDGDDSPFLRMELVLRGGASQATNP